MPSRARSRSREDQAAPRRFTLASLGSDLICALCADRPDLISRDVSQKISAWGDEKPSSTFTVGQSNATKQPTWNSGGYVTFGGAHGLRSVATLTVPGNFVIFAAVRLASAVPANGFVYEHSNNANTEEGSWILGQSAPAYIAKRGANASSYNPAIPRDDAWRLVRHQCDGTNAGHQVFFNGSSQSLTSGGSTANPGTGNAVKVLNVGARADGASFLMTGDLKCLVILARSAAVIAQMSTVESYLRSRFNV